MAYFTKDWYENMQDAHVLALPESDEEWADYIRSFEEEGEDIQTYLRSSLARIKERLLNVLPKEFHSPLRMVLLISRTYQKRLRFGC